MKHDLIEKDGGLYLDGHEPLFIHGHQSEFDTVTASSSRDHLIEALSDIRQITDFLSDGDDIWLGDKLVAHCRDRLVMPGTQTD